MSLGREGLAIRNEESGFRIKAGDISQEMLYDAAEMGDRFWQESVKQSGSIIGLHLRWRF